MYFKSYDGWKVVTNDGNKKAVLAQFTKADGELVHYVSPALKRKAAKPSDAMDNADILLLRKAISEGPSFFRAFEGWSDFGRGKKSIMIAHFTVATGTRARYGLSSLHEMAANPPKNFSPFDALVLGAAIETGPKIRR